MATLVQPLASKFHSTRNARGLVVTTAAVAVGLGISGVAVAAGSLLLGVVAGIVLGAGVGTGLVSGLREVQRIAGDVDLAGLTGVFYAVAYVGFLAPTILSALEVFAAPSILLGLLAIVAVVALALIALRWSKHLTAAND